MKKLYLFPNNSYFRGFGVLGSGVLVQMHRAGLNDRGLVFSCLCLSARRSKCGQNILSIYIQD